MAKLLPLSSSTVLGALKKQRMKRVQWYTSLTEYGVVYGKVNFAPKGTCSSAVDHKIRTHIRVHCGTSLGAWKRRRRSSSQQTPDRQIRAAISRKLLLALNLE